MDIEFHYWVTGLIAIKAGFKPEEAQIIAYASQYVDENDISIKVQDRNGNDSYSNYVSQTMNILKPKNQLMRIYPIFHFIPGEPDAESARRRDGKMHILNTTPNSANANEIIDAALKSPEDSRLYRIGIASHAFIDTWAHQNFVGWYDYFNNIGLDVKPDIGHADAEHHPDWVSHHWEDNRLVESAISNRERFTSAAEALYKKYCHYLSTYKGHPDKSSEWETFEKDLLHIQGSSYSGDNIRYENDRSKKYKEMLVDWPEFDESLWLKDAIEIKVRGLRDSQEGLTSMITLYKDEYFWKDSVIKEHTDWYKFQEAVKDHERFAIKLLTPVYRKMGYDLASV